MSQNKRRKNNAELVEKPTSLQGLRLQNINPKTQAQQDVFDAFNEGYHLFLHGVAGTGKTFISLYLALKTILTSKEYKKIVIIRSAVPSRDIGFLPGTAEEKKDIPIVHKIEFADKPTIHQIQAEKVFYLRNALKKEGLEEEYDWIIKLYQDHILETNGINEEEE